MKKRMNKTHSFPKLILAMGMMMSLGAGTVYAVPLPSKAQEMLQVSEDTQIYGTVVDENGDPVIGASVLVVGMKSGTSTDINGQLVLKGVKNGATLQISYIGYETITVKI
ncbi:MAG: carboxypeptidase-like regulatory domain-containing protein, partial [Bacteroides sp.]|nr:carboxypeptidase-like regulatory domain-containing protein [Bacteroides sp.]